MSFIPVILGYFRPVWVLAVLCRRFLYENLSFTYSSTQCPAVAIQFSFRIAPPHLWVDEKPKKDVLLTDTYENI